MLISTAQQTDSAIYSVQFNHSVVSDSLRPHRLQHARPPCPSPTPRVHSNSCPLSRWRHPTISSSVIPFSSHLQSFPASGSFPMGQLFASGGQSIGAWASAAHVCSSCVYVTWNYKAGMEDTSFVPCPCFALLIFLFYWLLVLWISDLLIQPPQSHELILQNLPFFLPSFPSSLFPSFYPFSLSFCLSFSLCLFFPIYLISLEFKH